MLVNECHEEQLFDGMTFSVFAPHLYCNMCGKDITDTIHSQERLSFRHTLGSHSIRTKKVVDFDLCLSCFNELLDKLQPLCKFNPIEEY